MVSVARRCSCLSTADRGVVEKKPFSISISGSPTSCADGAHLVLTEPRSGSMAVLLIRLDAWIAASWLCNSSPNKRDDTTVYEEHKEAYSFFRKGLSISCRRSDNWKFACPERAIASIWDVKMVSHWEFSSVFGLIYRRSNKACVDLAKADPALANAFLHNDDAERRFEDAEVYLIKPFLGNPKLVRNNQNVVGW